MIEGEPGEIRIAQVFDYSWIFGRGKFHDQGPQRKLGESACDLFELQPLREDEGVNQAQGDDEVAAEPDKRGCENRVLYSITGSRITEIHHQGQNVRAICPRLFVD